jgi:hypothetical protein
MSILPNATFISPGNAFYGSSAPPAPAVSPFTQGMVMLFDKTASLPTGWSPCDGGTYNGYVTPTLANVFVVGTGATYPTVGLGGGAASATLSLDMIPNHTHLGIPAQGTGVAEGSGGGYAVDGTGDSGLITGYATQLPVPTLPPYYSMQYICYVGVAP